MGARSTKKTQFYQHLVLSYRKSSVVEAFKDQLDASAEKIFSKVLCCSNSKQEVANFQLNKENQMQFSGNV